MTLDLHVTNETAVLEKVIIGIGGDRGKIVHEINPKISKYLKMGTYPQESVLIKEVEAFAQLVESEGVEVFRPDNMPDQDQIFTRDIAFAIDDKIIKSNMKKPSRRPEQKGMMKIINMIDSTKVLQPPYSAIIEGGDVVLYGKYIFVGLGDRTNQEGYEFLKNTFPNKEVIQLPVVVSGNPAINILHLDCTFQPVGMNKAMIFEDGFLHRPEAIYDIFGYENLIKVNQYEMYHLNTNLLSLSPEKVISSKSFERINTKLNSIGIQTLFTDYSEVSKIGGLFRCSSMPLKRKKL